MTSQEAIHKRNLESSILFMQQEHAATLKALHEEIQKLQKKCSDLTFELNMAGIDLGRNMDPATKEHIVHLEKMIDTQRETQHELEVELDKKDKLIKENEYTYKRQKMKHLEELRAKNQEIEQLKAELEVSANSTAFYHTQLHQHKKEMLMANQAAAGAGQTAMHVHAPAPPKESRANPKRSFHIRRTLLDKEELSLNPVRPDVRVSSGGTSRSDSPAELIRPFLPPEDAGEPEIHIKQSHPLPPIRTKSGHLIEPVDLLQVRVHNPTKPSSKTRSNTKPATHEVETLAIGSLSQSKHAWGQRRQNESHSSDYR